MSFATTIQKIVNIKFNFLNKAIGNTTFQLLDVGAGNRSASKTMKVFPNCIYSGVDLDKNTNYIEDDFKQMKAFYELDLTKLDYTQIPDNHYDYINMAHVIEHLYNGDQVVPLLLTKLKSGGYFYIEYPGKKSMHLPSMYGTLNFHDDPTHVRLYSVAELKPIFEANGCEIISSGTRRNWYYILALPFRAMLSLVQKGKLQGNIFWDLMGFAEYLYVRKK
jgi:SAM-dependent methyltransferase